MTRRLCARGVLAVAVVSAAATLCGVSGCVDLFHSTDFETLCDYDASAPGCDDARGSEAGRRGGDARADGATRDGRADGRARDGATDTTTPLGDGGVDARHDGGRAPSDADVEAAHDSGVDANFCNLTPPGARSAAEHACLWLGACAGTGGANDFSLCYPLAILAYDCTANPNQRVLPGPVHDYWQKLATASSCEDVTQAIFGGSVRCPGASGPTCTGSVVASCGPDGGVLGAENCAAQGYTCENGSCAVADAITDCPSASTCSGSVAHQCRTIASGPADIGKDCANFGAGRCFVEAGVAGCVPNDPGDACAPTQAVSCVTEPDADTYVVGCATGAYERIDCTELGGAAGNELINCAPGTAASVVDLASVCYPAVAPEAGCTGTQLLETVGGVGRLSLTCGDFGPLGHCSPADGGTWSCGPPTGG